MNNDKVMYVGRLRFGKVFKVCEDEAEAQAYHKKTVDSGMEITSHFTIPVTEPVVRIDRLSHVDVSNKVPN